LQRISILEHETGSLQLREIERVASTRDCILSLSFSFSIAFSDAAFKSLK